MQGFADCKVFNSSNPLLSRTFPSIKSFQATENLSISYSVAVILCFFWYFRATCICYLKFKVYCGTC